MSELRDLLNKVKAGKLPLPTVEREVRTAAGDLAATLGVKGCPQDLRTLLRARAISRIRALQMNEDGVLYALDERNLAVDLKRSNSEARNRFTCAHEIGHTYFLDKKNKDWFRSFRVSDGDVEKTSECSPFEERLCNTFAGELLLPTPFLRDQLFSLGMSWRTVFSIQRDTNNSLTACAVRCVQSGMARSLLVSWRLLQARTDSADFAMNWQISATSMHARVDAAALPISSPLLFKAISGLAHNRIIAGPMEIPLHAGGRMNVYSESINADRRTGTVLSLLVFDPAAEIYGSNAQRWFRMPTPQLELFR